MVAKVENVRLVTGKRGGRTTIGNMVLALEKNVVPAGRTKTFGTMNGLHFSVHTNA